MSDPPGLPSALGIEAVEWFSQEGGGENLTVRVTGRWRRRRPASTAQPTLVVEVHGYRHRYPAMPEPPSLTGTAPGTWRMTFSVPGWIAPHLGTRASLQLGGVSIPLPAQLDRVSAAASEPDPDTLAARQLQNLELLVRAARQRTREAEDSAAALAARVRELAQELETARLEPARLSARLAEAELARRAAEQRAYAEQRRREDAQDELAVRVRELADAEGPRADLAAALARVGEFESELVGLRRRLDEAEHLLAVASAARGRAERRGVQQRVTRGIRAELAVAIRTPPAPLRVGPSSVSEPPGLELERLTIASRGTQAQAQAAKLERELHEYATRCARAYDAIGQLRDQLEQVRPIAVLAWPADEQPAAPVLPGTEHAAAPMLPAAEYAAAPVPQAAGPVEAARLEAALSRLREATPAAPGAVATAEPGGASRPWLAGVLRVMLERDPAAAGRLVVALLPAQRLVQPRPLAYDLVLAEDGCVQVTVAGGYWRVERHDSPRAPEAVQFSIAADLPSLARYVATGRPRRRLRRAGARLSGDRAAARALPALAGVPLSVSALLGAGVQLDPPLALSVVASMVEPGWTRGERFAIAYQPPGVSAVQVHLSVRDGAPPAAAEGAPSEPVSTTIACPPESLLAVLDGSAVPGAQIGPDKRPLALLQGWMKRAQSG